MKFDIIKEIKLTKNCISVYLAFIMFCITDFIILVVSEIVNKLKQERYIYL